MKGRVASHLRHNTVAYIALFFGLGGGSIAVANHLTVRSSDIVDGSIRNADLGDSSVGTGKIKDGNVALQDLSQNSVGTGKVVDGSLTGSDIKPNSVGGVRIVDGSVTQTDLAAGTLLPVAAGAAFNSGQPICSAPTVCSLQYDKNVSSVTAGTIEGEPVYGEYCIGVEGATPASHMLIAGVYNSNHGSAEGDSAIAVGPPVSSSICPSDEFRLTVRSFGPLSGTVGFWFVVL